MSDFKFDGNWEHQIKLSELSKFSHPDFFNSKPNTNYDGNIKMLIEEVRNFNPDPENEQIKTINFLLSQKNQIEIIESIFKYIKDVAYPDFQSYFSKEEYPDNYLNLTSIDDLHRVIGFNGITIHNFFKDECAIYTLSFAAAFGYENHLNLTFDKTKILDHIEWSDFPSEKITEELGFQQLELTDEEYEKIREEELKLVLYKPHPKYGKLKSWQKSENDSYPSKLLYHGMYKELKSYIETKGDEIINLKSGFLYTITRGKRDVPKHFIEYLLEDKPTQIENIAPYALSLEDKSIFLKLVSYGYDINALKNDSTLITSRIATLKHDIQVKYFDRAEETKREIEYLMKMGANPNIRGKYKEDTFSYIKKIDEEQIRLKIEIFFYDLCEKHGFEIK